GERRGEPAVVGGAPSAVRRGAGRRRQAVPADERAGRAHRPGGAAGAGAGWPGRHAPALARAGGARGARRTWIGVLARHGGARAALVAALVQPLAGRADRLYRRYGARRATADRHVAAERGAPADAAGERA